MNIDDIRKFAHSNPEDFAKYLLADGWRWSNAAAAAHFERKYAQTLRDQFAIAALPAFLGAHPLKGTLDHLTIAANASYLMADDMMAARKEIEA